MRKLLVYLRAYLRESILSPLLKLMEAALDLIVPLVVAAVIDHGIAAADHSYILKMCLLLIGIGVAGLLFSVTAQYFAAKAAVGFVTNIRTALFRHIQSLSYSEMDSAGTSTLITRMTSDINQVQNGTNLTLRLLLRSPFIVIGSMVLAFTIDLPSALIFAVAVPVLAAVVFGIMLWCIPLYKKVQSRLDSVTGITRENLTGVRVIRAFRKEEDEIGEFENRNETLTKIQKFVGRISALMNPVTYVIVNLAIIWLIQTGALRVDSGLLTQGAVVALYNYMSQILIELVKFASFIISTTKAVACGNRIQAVFELQPSLKDGTETVGNPQNKTAVEFRHVDLRYRNAGANALTDLNFTAARGEIVGIIGGTGSGKSSLVNLIPRFYDVTGGSVTVDGVDVRQYRLEALRQKIGIVPQKSVLFQGTIRENIQWGKKDATDQEIMDAITAAQAKEVVDGKAGGLDFMIEQGGRNLSGGQRQRLTIARALVRRPELLILDDSASALDFATDAALRRSISSLPEHPTVFLISQRTASLQYADKIVVLEEGKIVGIGTHDDLLETCTVYREIYESQFKKDSPSAL